MPPKSPLDKPSSRRPGSSRTSSSEKPATKATKATASNSKHGVKAGQTSSKGRDLMSSVAAEASYNDIDDVAAKSHPGPQKGKHPGKEHAEQAKSAQQHSASIANFTTGRVPFNTSVEEVERLRQAMNAQLKLNQHREKLARHIGDKESRSSSSSLPADTKSRVSPIHEEPISPTLDAAFATISPSTIATASTESTSTIRLEATSTPFSARTPSYPFPSMRGGPSFQGGHRPFTALSPTVFPSNDGSGYYNGALYDQVLSGSITPASTIHFQPPGKMESPGESPFPTPNLYDLSLMLSAEPGLDAWWDTVVQLMREVYKAERVTLAVPADSTDLENVPWGQKATFISREEDQYSLGYLPRGSSLITSSVSTNDTSNSEDNAESPPMVVPRYPVRPGLLSRHSFTSFEDTKRDSRASSDTHQHINLRPGAMARAKSYLSSPPSRDNRTVTPNNTQLNRQALQDHMDYEDSQNPESPAAWEHREKSSNGGRLFAVLQALDYEADPLIDSSGVLRVLDRGRVIALTREYPYLDKPIENESSAGSKGSTEDQKPRKSQEDSKVHSKPELVSRISSFLGNKSSRRAARSTRGQASEKGKSLPGHLREMSDEFSKPPRYEEYEQEPPSPWAQSPAPSPAVRVETGENPFFANASIDEETFNPSISHDYTTMQPLEAIGVDRSWTVLHIPLMHPLLSKPVQSSRLGAATKESKNAWRERGTEQLPKFHTTGRPHEQLKAKRTPIAIISILSPVIPYPSNLRHSLQSLSPHLATSFSLCRHYSNLEKEIAGLSRKRPQMTGFGAVASGSRMMTNNPYSPFEDAPFSQATAGGLTSPSDYSGTSRTTVDSPMWDPGTATFSMDKGLGGTSPAISAGEGYFTSGTRPGVGRVDTGSASSITAARRTKENSPAETRPHQRNPDETPKTALGDRQENRPGKLMLNVGGSDSSASTPRQEVGPREADADTSDAEDTSPSAQQNDVTLSPRRQAMQSLQQQGQAKSEGRAHTQLHSYGADFGATFGSLPTTSVPSAKPPSVSRLQSRTGSMSLPTDMPPPSDRLKGLMLDSLPAHVFVALPQTGEIVWVNNRYLTYRGQTVSELYEDPWGSIHPEEREAYLKAWSHAVKTGEQFSMQVRIRRFDGTFRWFYTRAVGSRDLRGVIVQWYGSHMDIHEQHIAEVKAARQEEIEASEAKHRQLANLIPQIIFAATEEEGVTFANEQWLSYTGQDFEDALGLGFMDYIHPDDLAKCHIPVDQPPTPRPRKAPKLSRNASHTSSSERSFVSDTPTETTVKGMHQALSRNNSSGSSSVYEIPTADLVELARSGVIKVSKDSDGRLSYTTEIRLRNKLGEYRWHLVRCVEVDNINLGSRDGSWFGACTDINDHKLLEAKLKEAMESKGKFLSNMSHEIRTPLIGISGMVNFLQDTVLNDEQSDYANTISSSAHSLLNIINDILDLSKVDAGMMKLSHEWFHFRSLVEEVNEMVSTLAITKRLELNYVVDVEVPEMVKGDKFRIRQVLLNVIGNAIKFTTTGEVFTRCRVLHEKTEHLGDNKIMIEFSVIDTGQGFTQEEADLIFKPFSQIDGSSTRQHGGSGLGLVISRQLVELHGGKMEGSAVPNEGSTFTFSAMFGLATAEDHPEPLEMSASTNALGTPSGLSTPSSLSNEASAHAMRQAGGIPLLANKMMQSPAAYSPKTESSTGSPALLSLSSSNQSRQSSHSHAGSSFSSEAQSVTSFGEAAKATGYDLSHLKLALPARNASSASSDTRPVAPRKDSTDVTPTLQSKSNREIASHDSVHDSVANLKPSIPSMYSILLVCPQTHSREATTQHIEITLPKDVPHQITPLASASAAQEMICGDDPASFTHIVLNLPSAEDIVILIEQIVNSVTLPDTSIVILSDPVQRQEVIRMATSYDYDQLAKDNRVRFIYKPVKPSRFAVIFDPGKERDLSTDKNRSTAQQQVATQKQNYVDVGKRLGNRGFKILLVEDNSTNLKVMMRFLSKVGLDVELALDGVECTDKVFSHSHSYYSLILCDLHMPRKDGYQTCKEIREWEAKKQLPKLPIIALSANVMADVMAKCVEAGFNSYVTKPVDFKALSTAMSDLLDPAISTTFEGLGV